MRIEEHGGILLQLLDEVGPMISTPEDTSDLIGNAWVDNVSVIAVPVARLDPAFFDLTSLKAGEITQKVANYRLRLVIVGDITSFEASSSALRQYVWESNRGNDVWFVADEAALQAKLAR